jgi:hypothetical protein
VRKALNIERTMLEVERTVLNGQRSALNGAKWALDPGRTPVNAERIGLSGQRSAVNVSRAMCEVERKLLDAPKPALDRARTPRNYRRTMNRYQLNLTDMFSTVSAYMGKNNGVWSAVPAIGITVADLNAGIGAIDAADKKQGSPTGGATEDKEQARNAFEDKILFVADQLAALAAKNKDAALAGKVELTLSQLDKMPAETLEATGKRIKDLANANIAALADYGVLPADVTELDTLTTNFFGKKTAPREAVVDRKKETDIIPGLIADVRSILRNRLDKQMTAFKRSQPEFYAGYLTARVIVDRGNPAKKKPAPPAPPQ